MCRKLNISQKYLLLLTLLPTKSGAKLPKFFVHVVVVALVTLSLFILDSGNPRLRHSFLLISYLVAQSLVFNKWFYEKLKTPSLGIQGLAQGCPQINLSILPVNFPLVPNFTTRLWPQKDLGSNLGSASYCVMTAGCKTSFSLHFPIFVLGIVIVATDFWLK